MKDGSEVTDESGYVGCKVAISPDFVAHPFCQPYAGEIGQLTRKSVSGGWYARFGGQKEQFFSTGGFGGLHHLVHPSSQSTHEVAKQRESTERQGEARAEASEGTTGWPSSSVRHNRGSHGDWEQVRNSIGSRYVLPAVIPARQNSKPRTESNPLLRDILKDKSVHSVVGEGAVDECSTGFRYSPQSFPSPPTSNHHQPTASPPQQQQQQQGAQMVALIPRDQATREELDKEVRGLRLEVEEARHKAHLLEAHIADYHTQSLHAAAQAHQLKLSRDTAESRARELEAAVAAAQQHAKEGEEERARLRADLQAATFERQLQLDNMQRQVDSATHCATQSTAQLVSRMQELEEEVARERAESSRLRRDGEEAEEGRRQLQHQLMHHANATGMRHVEVGALEEAAGIAQQRILELDTLVAEQSQRISLLQAEVKERGAAEEAAAAHAAAAAAEAQAAAQALEDAEVGIAAAARRAEEVAGGLQRELADLQTAASQLQERNGVLAKLLVEAEDKLRAGEEVMGLLQREAKESRSLNQRRLSQAADAAQAEELLREQVGVLEDSVGRLQRELREAEAAVERGSLDRSNSVRGAQEAERSIACLQLRVQQLEAEVEVGRTRQSKEEQRGEHLTRALADAQALGESCERQGDATCKALEDLQKQLVAVIAQKEEAERSLSAAVWRECAADGNRKLELREAEEARAHERVALQAEEQRAVRADATANAILAQVQGLEREISKQEGKVQEAEAAVQRLTLSLHRANASCKEKEEEAARMRTAHERLTEQMSLLQREFTLLEARMHLESGRVEAKEAAAEAAQAHARELQQTVKSITSERQVEHLRAKQLELALMEAHTRIALAESAAAQAHERQVAAEKTAQHTARQLQELEAFCEEQRLEAALRVRAAEEEAVSTRTNAERALAQKVAQTQSLLAAREQDNARQLDVEVSRRGELSAASQQLLQRNSQLEDRLAEHEAKEVVLRAALDEMSAYVERVAGARRADRLADTL